jgi:uncharacterized Zn finger protein (UPF0148 family)
MRKCERCKGTVMRDAEGDLVCINCGHRPEAVLADQVDWESWQHEPIKNRMRPLPLVPSRDIH